MKQLWYKKYRPDTIEGFVFVDDHIKEVVTEWVEKKEFPHLLLAGAPGTGKCLDGSEIVQVRVDVNRMIPEQLCILNMYKKEDSFCIPVGKLFAILGMSGIQLGYGVSPPVNVEILSPSGYVPVEKFVLKKSPIVRCCLANGVSFKCADKHVVMCNGAPTLLCDAQHLDTLDGSVEIQEIIPLKEGYVYDFELRAPHVYMTPNGVIHHNTTLAYVLTNSCGIEEVDVKYIAASVSKGIDTIRDEIITFVERSSFGDKGRVVILDEVDETTPAFMTALRNLIGEMYDSCRFILTANYPHKIIPALKSRLHTITFSSLDHESFMERIVTIVDKENVEADVDTLFEYINKYYPDMRRTINAIENNTIKGVLRKESAIAVDSEPDWMKEAVVYFEQGLIKEARNKIVGNITDSLYDDFYTMLYRNLSWFSDTEDGQDAALLIIRKAYVDDRVVANREIVLSSCLVQLSKLSKR